MDAQVELKNVVLHLYESITGDAKAIESLFSHHSTVLAIGTDPKEWWVGYDTIARVFKAQSQEMELGGTQLKTGGLNVSVEGTVGWVADRPTIQLPGGQEMGLRMTAVLHQEDGAWKIVQYHISIGVPNEEAIGKELTTQ